MTRLGRFIRQAFIAGEVRAFSIIHQTTFAVLLGAVSISLGLLRPESVHVIWLLSGLFVLVLATVGAFVTNRFTRTALPDFIIPLLDFAALGMCRYATYPDGGALSVLSLIPAVWLVITLRRRGVIIATAAVLVTVTPVNLFGGTDTTIDTARVLLAALLPVAVAMTAGMVAGFDMRVRASNQRLRTALLAQEKLTSDVRRSSSLLRTTGESVNVGLLILDGHGASIFENSAFRAHLEHATPADADLADDSSWTVFAADAATEVAPEQRPLVRARRGEVFKDELIWVGSPGVGQRALSVSTTSLLGDAYLAPHMIVVTYDVTATQHLIRAREEILASVSHELRTPLTSIMGYTELAIDELDESVPTSASANPDLGVVSSSIGGHLEVIRRNSEQLYALVEDILLEQQAESQRLDLDSSPVDLSSLIEEVVRSLQPAAADHGVRLSIDGLTRSRVMTDPKRITQVLTNLVFNGIKYSGAGHRVSVESRTDDTGVGFDVKDDGPGMPGSEVDRLFTPFFRGAAARESTTRGVGLGLSVTKSIVDAHNGTISVSSTPGRGSTFSVRLPARPAGE
ncbi:HAMP domain-containing sensor histidine kinase [Brevibacterium sp. ZH18]|uniref:sensor histidine kinase n=1 Tax=Brevibacterium sp. ZH18 TaxID=2927784 RepID=UPI001F60AA92|nr:HAMP domain-containing sensor histidine kinase [Brevibacterium sp. ZH18]MCI4012419.1 HAMP domain-containing histidine kinase [Brevibacterium sp. ZH18]